MEFEDSHLNAYKNNPYISFVTLCDRLKPDGKHHLHYLDMVQLDYPDIVSVCTPPETHCQIVCDIAPYVKAIWCEKPIAMNLDEADRMIEVCKENNTILQINHQRRWMRPKFKFSRGIFNSGSHAFDLVNFLFKDLSIVDFEYIDTDEYIFEFNLTHPEEPLLPKALDHLIWCLENGQPTISSGENGRRSLEQCINFQALLEHPKDI
uniref:Putative oxidoreductase family protein n=1 Tax=viral metagenome TaxID=1070528 RepID=A0A6M3IJD5_9ZZZZ